ncbi:hypothetical protein ANN_20951 [Periplaneta americana]|uniref:DUF4817 domain-containing protein n=1 Tax=Periplaneta americana TaxID=6978 RepID=A0ABQ8SF60_PERAM|nr:hypothetical protein ANN_20951 [Periplaneta americana]
MIQMATTNQQRVQCVLWYAKFESVKTVQREFRYQGRRHSLSGENQYFRVCAHLTIYEIAQGDYSRKVGSVVGIALAFCARGCGFDFAQVDDI